MQYHTNREDRRNPFSEIQNQTKIIITIIIKKTVIHHIKTEKNNNKK